MDRHNSRSPIEDNRSFQLRHSDLPHNGSPIRHVSPLHHGDLPSRHDSPLIRNNSSHLPFIRNNLDIDGDDDVSMNRRVIDDGHIQAGSFMPTGNSSSSTTSGLRGMKGLLLILFVVFLLVMIVVELILTSLLISALKLTPSAGFPAFLAADDLRM